jgi:outer membrane protein OmpA-like peptidoglycan-associated protein
MKKLFPALVIMLASFVQLSAQDLYNGPYLGLKAGANFSTLNMTSNAPDEYSNGWRVSPVGGIFGNIPIAKRLSFQMEALYGGWGGLIKQDNGAEITQKTSYASIPLMLKIHASQKFKFLLGAEWDILLSGKAENKAVNTEVDNKEKLGGDDWGITGGLEFWPAYNWVISARYIQGINEVTHDPPSKNMNIQLTLGFRFGKKPVPVVVAPVVVPVVVDTDNDGIADAADKCPTVPGIAKYDGCPIPDTDKDGINDEQDKCPTVAGLAKYNGCPIPDTDGDGINDEEDKCPTVAGLARYQGCPIPDTDGDGINDEEDKCISVAGLADNKGCPEMVFYYKRAEAALDAKEKADLDRLVVWMGNHPELNVSINGHTSTLGATDYNQKLSERRAQNTVKYLVSKGIDPKRLKAVGYGEQFPIGDNSKEEGRALSRRVVMRIAD